MSYTATFDGHDLSDLFTITDVTRSVAAWETTSVDVPGRNGSMVTGTRAVPVDVSMTLWTKAPTVMERQESLRALAAWLAVDEPKALQLGDENGLWRMALPVEAGEVAQHFEADSTTLTFRCYDPILYGDEVTVTVPSGGSVTFTVGGTAPTWPTVAASSALEGSSGYWRLILDEGDHLDADTGSSAKAVSADCAKRVLRVNNSVQMLQPSADWLRLTPGEHTVRMNGTGAATLTWRERWW